MEKETIYSLAIKCKTISDTEIRITKFVNSTSISRLVTGNIRDFARALDRLCDAIKDKYYPIYSELKMHMDKYDSNRLLHQGAIDAILNCLIEMEKPCQSHGKKIFISHSSKDKSIIQNFTNLVLGLGIGIDPEDIFCTSIEDMTMRNGEDIRQHIRNNILTADFSFLMISQNYKTSEICLNEMGAVWAANNTVRYYILPNTSFEQIGWLNEVKKAENLCDSIVLDSLHKEIMAFYDLPDKGITWSTKREEFISSLKM